MPEINEYGQQVNDLVPWLAGAQVLRRTALNGRFAAWSRWTLTVMRGSVCRLCARRQQRLDVAGVYAAGERGGDRPLDRGQGE